MKRCLACGATYPSDRPRCQACGVGPGSNRGFPVYIDGFARADGFKASYFADLVQLEEGHFWFRSRNRMIIWALGKYCPRFRSFLEVGCGTGYVLSGIARAFPGARLHGSEIFIDGLAVAAARLPEITFMQIDARRLPFVDEFDAVGAFDVLEHIDEDEDVVAQLRIALKQGGIMLLTVPQHRWLWSSVDEYACHVRRYSADEIHAKVKTAGFDILHSTSFVSSLLPVMVVSRFLQKSIPAEDVDGTAELNIHPWLNWLFEKVLAAEMVMIRCGVNFPVGGSRLVVARKT